MYRSTQPDEQERILPFLLHVLFCPTQGLKCNIGLLPKALDISLTWLHCKKAFVRYTCPCRASKHYIVVCVMFLFPFFCLKIIPHLFANVFDHSFARIQKSSVVFGCHTTYGILEIGHRWLVEDTFGIWPFIMMVPGQFTLSSKSYGYHFSPSKLLSEASFRQAVFLLKCTT